jgi:2,3-bisphosphoglycerate-dependent phosphoglycerate mutase
MKEKFIFNVKRFFMKYCLLLFIVVAASCSHTYYVVRHAEKAVPAANMGSDVPLSAEGEQRAIDLKEALKNEKIAYVYSTNTIRTKTTAKPTADHFGLTTEMYGPKPDSTFIALLKAKKKNTLVVGHSNTIDDVVNMLCGEKKVAGDLAETQYDNLFVVKKKGKRYVFTGKKYGKPTP